MLQLVIGPMWSGKTFHCIRLARRYRAIGKKVIFVDHISDVRYSRTHVVSHDGDTEHCIFLETLEELIEMKEYKEADVVIIEEAQFFPDLHHFITKEVDNIRKDFIVSGLSGDSERKPIGEILLLIPYAEYVEKLNGLCNICKNGNIGCFTKSKINKIQVVLVGGKELYECVCRKHYIM